MAVKTSFEVRPSASPSIKGCRYLLTSFGSMRVSTCMLQWDYFPFEPALDWLMELVLTGLNWKICPIYLDHVVIHGGNFYYAMDRLKLVWEHVREAQLKLKASKRCLMHERVPFLKY